MWLRKSGVDLGSALQVLRAEGHAATSADPFLFGHVCLAPARAVPVVSSACVPQKLIPSLARSRSEAQVRPFQGSTGGRPRFRFCTLGQWLTKRHEACFGPVMPSPSARPVEAAGPGAGAESDPPDSPALQRAEQPLARERRAFGNSAFHWCLLLLAVGAVLAFLPLFAPLLLASWMALTVRSLHAKLARKVGGRGRAAGVVTVLLVAVALAPLLVIVLSLVGSSMTLVERLQKSGGVQEGLQTLLTRQAAPVAAQFDLHLDLRRVMEFVQSHGSDALNAATKLFGAASAGAVGIFVFIYGFYTCLVDGPRAYAWLLDHCPLERWQTTRLAAAYEETGRGMLIGVGLTALFQGAVATVGYAIIGVPQALVFGLVTVFGALIPSVGTALVWVPLAIGLFAAGQKGSAAAVVGLGVVVSVADNFVRPLLSRHGQLDLPSFLLFVAMLGGIVTFGGWGLLVGPLFVRLALEALRLGRERRELGQDSTLLRADEPLIVPGE